jgi:hypothetical protein
MSFHAAGADADDVDADAVGALVAGLLEAADALDELALDGAFASLVPPPHAPTMPIKPATKNTPVWPEKRGDFIVGSLCFHQVKNG